ncbi:MAG TPA: acyltransferase [Polyangiaceae bacterium]|nr:acyltransferase [Polyangiaceae bacterium]
MPEKSAGASWARRFFSLELLDNRYPQLHGLRVLAIVSVVQFHITTIFALEQAIRLDRDWVGSSLAIFFGMDLFFILSGFLIGSILLHSLKQQALAREKGDKPRGLGPIARFYLRRIFRTFPPYYVVLTVLALLYAPLTHAQRHHLPYEYAYLTNFFGLARFEVIMFWGWSLALEEQFYLVVPLLFFLLGRLRTDRARLVLLAVLWACGTLSRLGIYYWHLWQKGPWDDVELYGAIYFRTYTRFDTLVMGIILAVLHDRFREPIGRWLSLPLHRALLAMPSLLCLWLLLRPWTFVTKSMQQFHVFAWGTLTTLMYLGFLILLLHGEGLIHRFLSAPIFRRLATLGYGIYLVHIPLCDYVVVPMAHKLDARHVSLLVIWPLSLALLLALSLSVSYAMHVLVEKPSLRLRDRVAG